MLKERGRALSTGRPKGCPALWKDRLKLDKPVTLPRVGLVTGQERYLTGRNVSVRGWDRE